MEQKQVIEEVKERVSIEMREELKAQLEPLAVTLKEIQDALVGTQFSNKSEALIPKIINHEERITKIETLADRGKWIGLTILSLAGIGTVQLIDFIKSFFEKH